MFLVSPFGAATRSIHPMARDIWPLRGLERAQHSSKMRFFFRQPIIMRWGEHSMRYALLKRQKLNRQRITLRQAPEGPTFNNP